MPRFQVGDRVQAVHYVTPEGTPATHNLRRCSVHVGDIGTVMAVSRNGMDEWVGIRWDTARDGMHNLSGLLTERRGYNVTAECILLISRDGSVPQDIRKPKPKRVSGFAKFNQKVSVT